MKAKVGVSVLVWMAFPLAAMTQEALVDRLEWRNIGPANMGGRTTDVEGVSGNPDIVYVGTASGGVWKTTNGGVRWKPLFDKQPVASIGDLALEPGNPEVIYLGTGEANTRNSVSFGNGIYKSTDGGETWRHLGLAATERISRIVINPRNPKMVYVGAVGKIFGRGEERGVFMSEDGGETWKKVLYVDDQHGVADMDIDPENPNVVYAAMWRFERKPWTHTSGSDKGGVFRSVDGGRTWKKLEKGLPKLLGRIGVKVAPGNPRVVYVIAESNEGTLFRSEDRGESFSQVNKSAEIVSRGFYFTDIRVDPVDENRVYSIASPLFVSIDGGKTFKRISRTTHGDYHTMWIDTVNPRRIWQGDDGGLAVSYDRGETYEYVNHFPLGQFYQLYADNRQPFYYVGGGLQDNGTWQGPSRSREPYGILNEDWRMVSFGDGFHIVVHPENPDLFLSEYQGGGIVRTDMATREQQDASPQPRRNDGGPAGELRYRFNWNAPIVTSPHDPKVVYFGGNVVFRSRDWGLNWEVISPDLSANDPEKLQSPGGPVWLENTTAEYHCTVISLAESPAQGGVLWAGTDDGNLQVSRDGGQSWTNVVGNIRGLPANSPVSHVEPSRAAAATAYVSFDRHMFDDFRPHVFKTTDFGKTWADVSANLPENGYVFVVREDPKNPNLLYAGTEVGLYASYTGGKDWTRLHLKNLPTVAVHDIIVHPRDNDLILGTHGRSIWIFDDATPLQQLAGDWRGKPAHLFPVRPALRFTMRPTRYGIGDKVYRGPNPPYGALLTYYLKEKVEKDTTLKLEILDGSGVVIRGIKDAPGDAGLNRVAWDLAYDPARPRRERKEGEEEEEFFFGPPRGPRAVPGVYKVRLTVGRETYEQPVEVRLDPTIRMTAAELKQQFDLALKLRELQSQVNDALAGLDGIKEQLEERKKTAATLKKEGAEELAKLVDGYLGELGKLAGQLVRPEGKPFWSQSPRVSERLGALAGGVDGVNAPPTAAQVGYAKELEQETNKALDEVHRYFASSLAEINRALAERGLPPLAAPR